MEHKTTPRPHKYEITTILKYGSLESPIDLNQILQITDSTNIELA